MPTGVWLMYCSKVAQPNKPPPPRLTDQKGAPCIVDERLLALVDDLIERLKKWLAEA